MSVRLSFGSRAGSSADSQGGRNGSNFQGGGHWSKGPFNALEDLTDSLKADIHAAQNSAIPDCTTVELHLSLTARLPLNRPNIGPYAEGGEQDLPVAFKTTTTLENGTVISDPFPKADVYSIVNISDGRQRQIVQRAASRGIIAAIEAVDGYRYSFNNAWNAKDEEGSRFSYICQDSIQNKDRHANGFTRTLKHLKGDGERGPRKPTYDCKGSLSVKFSTTRQSVDVYYRHYAIHVTVAERKPPPRPAPRPRQSIDKSTPKDTGGLAAALKAASAQAEQHASSALSMANQSPNSDSPLGPQSETHNAARPMKRKRDWESQAVVPPPRDPHQPLSLVELLQQSETANAQAAGADGTQQNRTVVAPPVNYELPSWQAPHPPHNQPTGGFPSSYPAPYSPQQTQAYNQSSYAMATRTPNRAANPKIAHQAGQPTSSHPQAQGLFTTMKQQKWVVQPHFPQVQTGGSFQSAYDSFDKRGRDKMAQQQQTRGWQTATQSSQSTPAFSSQTHAAEHALPSGWTDPPELSATAVARHTSSDPWFAKR